MNLMARRQRGAGSERGRAGLKQECAAWPSLDDAS